jgi:iron complex outermembrane recepter protein
VLRGPFSVLYGNAAGGAVAITTADAPQGTGLIDGDLTIGSFATRRAGLSVGQGTSGSNVRLDLTDFRTDGYRDHSRAERRTANAKWQVALGEHSRLTLVGNALDTPEALDPLGLTAAQVTLSPTAAGTNAVAYNTRKSLSQEQLGARWTSEWGDHTTFDVTAYGGHRATTQFQAILRATELANPLHPGGVVDLARDYNGIDARIATNGHLGTAPYTLTVGANADALIEARHGYLNFIGTTLGVEGALRSDLGNQAHDRDVYVEAGLEPWPGLHVLAGARSDHVEIVSRNHLVASDPSRVRYDATSPVLGVSYRLRDKLQFYAAAGQGFETPTLTDLAYRSVDGSVTGLNTALVPARSRHYEAGLRAGDVPFHFEFAAFGIDTENELAVRQSAGGRSVYANIGPTQRRGAEIRTTTPLAKDLSVEFAYTLLRAVTLAPYTTCVGLPCVAATVQAGSVLPAVPEHNADLRLVWSGRAGVRAGLEAIARSRLYADDRNLAVAPASVRLDATLAYLQERVVGGARWRFSETLRLDNLLNSPTIGSVIVNDANGRYFEPAPGRTAYLLFKAERL